MSTEILRFKDRQILIQRRAFQRNINLMVPLNNKIKVTCSKTCSQKLIIRFLLEKESWLERVVLQHQALAKQYPPPTYRQGEQFLYLGVPHSLSYHPTLKAKYQLNWTEEQKLSVGVPSALWHEDYSDRPHPELKPQVLKHYAQWGKSWLTHRLRHWSSQMELAPKKITFRAQKKRWGSCSTQGHVSLNWKLVAAPLRVMDYVVIHELSHLKHPDHSKSFWSLVEKYCIDYKSCKKWLRDQHYQLDFLNQVSDFEA